MRSSAIRATVCIHLDRTGSADPDRSTGPVLLGGTRPVTLRSPIWPARITKTFGASGRPDVSAAPWLSSLCPRGGDQGVGEGWNRGPVP